MSNLYNCSMALFYNLTIRWSFDVLFGVKTNCNRTTAIKWEAIKNSSNSIIYCFCGILDPNNDIGRVSGSRKSYFSTGTMSHKSEGKAASRHPLSDAMLSVYMTVGRVWPYKSSDSCILVSASSNWQWDLVATRAHIQILPFSFVMVRSAVKTITPLTRAMCFVIWIMEFC